MKTCMNSTSILVIVLLSAANVAAVEAPAKSPPVISACDEPFMVGFGAWGKAETAFPKGIAFTAAAARMAGGGEAAT